VLSGRGLCDELITRDCGASLCVIQKPRQRGGPGPLGLLCRKEERKEKRLLCTTTLNVLPENGPVRSETCKKFNDFQNIMVN
jgi:hypothetical protein